MSGLGHVTAQSLLPNVSGFSIFNKNMKVSYILQIATISSALDISNLSLSTPIKIPGDRRPCHSTLQTVDRYILIAFELITGNVLRHS